jgi:hypothetical protein
MTIGMAVRAVSFQKVLLFLAQVLEVMSRVMLV